MAAVGIWSQAGASTYPEQLPGEFLLDYGCTSLELLTMLFQNRKIDFLVDDSVIQFRNYTLLIIIDHETIISNISGSALKIR
ncbi:hypothetical protein CEXT_632131 [Caerostris extrusa]|uniref:Uncharacterized protein n=1 Tax=Caerostris extrusa TaxID=172846 RepID=A0AAV4M3T5_CAEEX|nr:hypothetical protein CEXT_632131 [Caerostris extrusa]